MKKHDGIPYHSRPWEKLPEGVVNLLDLHSLYAYWDNVHNTWRIKHTNSPHGNDGMLVFDTDTLEQWIAAVDEALGWGKLI